MSRVSVTSFFNVQYRHFSAELFLIHHVAILRKGL
jgi:hypothetical protein